jgi:hypothetical protein
MKGRLCKCILAITLAVTLSCFFGFALAQDKPADNMDLVRQKVQADKKLFIAENMQLTESEAKGFWPVYDSYQAELRKLMDRSFKLIEDFASNYAAMSDEVAKKLLDEYMSIEADYLKLRQSYLPKFRGTLSDIKVARYYQLENKIDAVIDFELARKIPLFQ